MTTNYGDNAFAPGMTSDAYIPDQLIAGDAKVVTESVTISGAAAYVRGTALGAYVTAATAAAAAGGGNTGNGVMGAVTASGQVQEGIYRLKVTKAAANAGDFEVFDPRGVLVGLGTVGVAFAGGGLAFTLADGATDFVVGDTFAITTSAMTVKYKTATAAATDGSQIATAILAEAVDATSADQTGPIYIAGEFNSRAVTLGAGMTLAEATAQLRLRNIFLKTAVSASEPT